MVGRFQVAQALKFEMLMPVRSAESPTACMNFNYHRDHFGATWGLASAKARNWPAAVRAALRL
jgi:seryl-tRNA synthetase